MFGGDEIKIRRNLVRRWGRWGWQQQQHESDEAAAVVVVLATMHTRLVRSRGGDELKVVCDVVFNTGKVENIQKSSCGRVDDYLCSRVGDYVASATGVSTELRY